ncbi:hypothetical protein [Virgibacillus sp. CBA3643]|uniref:hypothetical protein n=1 Tax=Virgibacillus sp. CBA3643 TaxID=2942278 RepID=UPI0035A3861E
MAEVESNLTIGMADITIDGTSVPRQADAAVFSAEPVIQEVDLYLVPAYDRIIEGWTVSTTVVVDEYSLEYYQMALGGMEEDETGFTDGKGMKSLRKEAKEVVIHPRDMGDDTSLDITIFKAVPTGAFERTFGKEVAGYEITLTGLHKTGDPKQAGNYFRIGEPVVDDGGSGATTTTQSTGTKKTTKTEK